MYSLRCSEQSMRTLRGIEERCEKRATRRGGDDIRVRKRGRRFLLRFLLPPGGWEICCSCVWHANNLGLCPMRGTWRPFAHRRRPCPCMQGIHRVIVALRLPMHGCFLETCVHACTHGIPCPCHAWHPVPDVRAFMCDYLSDVVKHMLGCVVRCIACRVARAIASMRTHGLTCSVAAEVTAAVDDKSCYAHPSFDPSADLRASNHAAEPWTRSSTCFFLRAYTGVNVCAYMRASLTCGYACMKKQPLRY